MAHQTQSFCRICLNACPLLVEVSDGRVVEVKGESDNPLFEGYTCIKGRSQPDYLYHPDRLLHSLKRMPDGRMEKIPIEQAMDEIANRLSAIRQESGADAIASYAGTMLFTSYTTSMPMLNTMMDSLGSSMRFNTDTIDKGGKLVAASLHGEWMAPACGFDAPDVMLLIGIDPIVTFTGLPTGNPGQWLKRQKQRGMKLIVIDPRRTYVAKRADLHLRPKPGVDVDIVACLIHVVLKQELFDKAFARENLSGIDELRHAVAAFDPNSVAQRTGLKPAELTRTATMLAGQKRGYLMAGTGPHMAGQGTLTEYLVLALQSLCGFWLRAGERVAAPPTLMPTPTYKAQVRTTPGQWAFGKPLGELGLRETKAGLPITALPDLMLAEDDSRVRALITVGGNPVVAIPDTHKTAAALQALDLCVLVDPWLSRSAEFADYVIAPSMPLEVAATTKALDFLSGWTGYGLGTAYAQYTPAVVSPPAGADVIDDWQFLDGLTKRLSPSTSSASGSPQSDSFDEPCTTDELLEIMTEDSRVPLSVVKQHPAGHQFPEPAVIVGGKDEGWGPRFDLANEEMLRDLQQLTSSGPQSEQSDAAFPLRLLCRRHLHVYNSSCNLPATNRGKAFNPAFLSTDDMQRLELVSGERISLRSAHGCVAAIAEHDPDLPSGCVSMMFAFGGKRDGSDDVEQVGSNPNLLIKCDAVYDRYTGQPRMSNIPVEVIKQHAV